MSANGLRPYPAYRDSGVEWLGRVPEHWEVRRLGATTERLVAGTWGSDPTGHDDIVCVRVADFDRRRLGVNLRKPTLRSVPVGERQRRLLEPGDLLLEKSGGGDLQPVGVVVHFDHGQEAVASNFIGRMRVRRQHSARYVLYLNSVLYAIRLTVRSIKQTTGIQNLDVGAYLSESVPLPSLSEQHAIARFLDYADRRIRRYTRAKERLVELLEERKRALIHEAVTGRIDVRTGQPYPAYKDSGVEWLGKVPEHWEVVALRHLATKFGSGVTPRGGATVYEVKGIPLLRSQNVHFEGLRLEGVARIPLHLHLALNGTHVKPRDVLLNITGASIGRVCTVPDDLSDANVNQHVCIIRPRPERVLPDFLAAFLSTPGMQEAIALEQVGASRQGLTLDSIRSFKLFVPPVLEQTIIGEAVHGAWDRFDLLASAAQRQIALLKEYRTCLIADVVTGKMDVREAAARLPETNPLTDDRDRTDPIPTESNLHSTAQDMMKEAGA